MKVLDQGAMGQISGEEISLIGGTPNSWYGQRNRGCRRPIQPGRCSETVGTPCRERSPEL